MADEPSPLPRDGLPAEPSPDPQGRTDIEQLLAHADAATLSRAQDDIITHLAHTLAYSNDPAMRAPSLLPGEVFGEHRIIRALGSGGMGIVYEAEHRPSGRRVALKTLNQRFTTSEARERFTREGQLAASINHRHVVFVFGSEEVNGVPVIVMELVPGGTLRDRVETRGPLPVTEAVDAVLDVIDGLEAARQAGILHRDIKPSNCFVDSDGSIKVGDFGLSISSDSEETRLTTPGRILGTPAFSSPEQLCGQTFDERSDIYSVGATLYYLLTGRPPIDAPDLVTLITRVLKERPKTPSELRPSTRSTLSRVVMTCLAKDPAARIHSYPRLKAALIPFSSRGLTTAPLPARIAAGLVDAAVVLACTYIVNYGVTIAALAGTTPLWAIGALHWLADASIVVLYFTLTEGLVGRSPGRWVFGLRIVRTDNSPVRVGRAFVRAVVFALVVFAPGVAWNWPTEPRFQVRTAPPAPYANVTWPSFPLPTFVFEDPVAWLLLLSLFVTARRENRFAGVHELMSGTRVVTASSDSTAISHLAPHARLEANSETRVGPYQVPADQRRPGAVAVGFDPRLRRPVWIQYATGTATPITESRRDLARSTRPRWLAGARGDSSWDAYEFVDGEPLIRLTAQRPWRVVRSWLAELTGELVTGFKDGSLPALHLDRIWITTDGHIKLLDWSVGETFTEDVDTVSPPTLQHIQQLLHAVAMRSIEGPAWSPATRRAAPNRPLPLAARSAIQDLASECAATADEVAELCQKGLGGEAELPRYRRLLLVMMLGALPAIIVAQGVYREGDAPIQDAIRTRLSVVRSQFDLAEGLDSGRLADPDGRTRQAVELVLGAWLPPFPHGVSLEGLPDYLVRGARWAERGRTTTPAPSRQQLDAALSHVTAIRPLPSPSEASSGRSQPSKAASALIAKLSSARSSGFARPPSLMHLFAMRVRNFVESSVTPALVFLALIGGCTVLAAVSVGRGLALRQLRVGVVRRDGEPATRLVLAQRALLLMAPAAATSIGVALLDWDMGVFSIDAQVIEIPGQFSGWISLTILLVTLALYAVGAGHAVARPSRSVIDQLTGTTLVPGYDATSRPPRRLGEV